ncbi:MAG: hypothetical protein ACR2NV_12255, partial [Thermoleophilaceae bacterium]
TRVVRCAVVSLRPIQGLVHRRGIPTAHPSSMAHQGPRGPGTAAATGSSRETAARHTQTRAAQTMRELWKRPLAASASFARSPAGEIGASMGGRAVPAD